MLKRLSQTLLILTLICLGFFCPQILQILHSNYTRAAIPDGMAINEIAWMGTASSANDEWIELFNNSGQTVDLTGWKLEAVDGQPKINLIGQITAGGYFLLERSSDETIAGITADQIYTGALGNSGEKLELRDSANNLIDTIDASSGWPAGDNTTKATMERKEGGSWQTSAASGGTPKMQNSSVSEPSTAQCGDNVLETSEQCDDGNLVNGDGCNSSCQRENIATSTPSGDGQLSTPSTTGSEKYKLGNAVINEFISDPADNEVEWVEVYNTTDKEINLSGWSIEEGSKTKTNLTGKLGISGSSRFYIVEKPKGNLNNAGDIIILYDGKGNLIDQVSYGNWDDGNVLNNTPIANDPASVARVYDGLNSYNNHEDFKITAKPTKGSSNIIKQVEEGEESGERERGNYDLSNDIFITEIFPNPEGDDSQGEFIELYNRAEREVNLAGWSLADEGDKKVEISRCASSTIIKPGEYLAIFRLKSKLVLNNDKDTVKLFQPLVEKAYQTVKYSKAVEGRSYNRVLAHLEGAKTLAEEWEWNEVITPGGANILKNINHAPKVNFNLPEELLVGVPLIFDSSDSYDEDGDELKFSWDFGDGIKNNLACPEHTFLKVGNYSVKLVVTDGENEVKEEKIVKVVTAFSSTTAPPLNPPSSEGKEGAVGGGEVIINEILPNPVGPDTEGEWLELKSNSLEKVNLLSWKVVSNKDSYEFLKDIWLEPQSFFLLNRRESNLTLNNELGVISLFNNFSDPVDEVQYEKAIENEAYARGENNKWFWTTILTPGEENIISVTKSSEGRVSGEFEIAGSGESITETSLDKVKKLEVGDKIKVKGVVAVEPGILGSQIFYIVSPTPPPLNLPLGKGEKESGPMREGDKEKEMQVASGLQIYSYKKDFPSLKIGDLIEVSGELSQVSGEMRLKTKSKDDIKVIEHGAVPEPVQLSCSNISEENVGQLLSVTGQITDRKSYTVYIDDGSDELIVYIKSLTGIEPKKFIEGSLVQVVGILGLTKTGLRLMPRSMDDLIIKPANATEPQVLGEVTSSDEWEIEAKDKKMELFKYLLVIAGGMIIVLVGLLVKYGRKKEA